MNKLNSRKLWAFIAWTILIALGLILKRQVSAELIQAYSIVTVFYIGGQSAIDFIKTMKGKDE